MRSAERYPARSRRGGAAGRPSASPRSSRPAGSGGRGRMVIGCVWACGGLLLLISGLSAATVYYPRAYRDLHAYERAARCTVPLRGADCTSDVDAVVTRVYIGHSKADGPDKVTVTGPAGFGGSVELEGSEPVLSRLKPGDHVTVRVWHSKWTQIAAGGRVQATPETPVGVPLSWLATGLAFCLFGLVAFDYAARYLSRRLHARWNEAGQTISAVGKTLVAAAVLAFLATLLPRPGHDPSPGPYFLTLALSMTTTGGVFVAVWWFRRYSR
jgi:hypothetical protein